MQNSLLHKVHHLFSISRLSIESVSSRNRFTQSVLISTNSTRHTLVRSVLLSAIVQTAMSHRSYTSHVGTVLARARQGSAGLIEKSASTWILLAKMRGEYREGDERGGWGRSERIRLGQTEMCTKRRGAVVGLVFLVGTRSHLLNASSA